MVRPEVRSAITAIEVVMADLGEDELEELAILASEIRRRAWAIRAQKIRTGLDRQEY